jgi:hypothetical protein
MTQVVDMFKRTIRCAYCHAVGTVTRMIRANGKYYCNHNCHQKHQKQKL